MKVTVIKGPMFEKVEKEAHKLLYQIISQKIQKNDTPKSKKEAI